MPIYPTARRASTFIQPFAHEESEKPPKYWPALVSVAVLAIAAGLSSFAGTPIPY